MRKKTGGRAGRLPLPSSRLPKRAERRGLHRRAGAGKASEGGVGELFEPRGRRKQAAECSPPDGTLPLDGARARYPDLPTKSVTHKVEHGEETLRSPLHESLATSGFSRKFEKR